MNATTTTSRDECVSNDIALRNQLVIEMLDRVGGMVSNFVCKYRLEFDDCMQHAALVMLEAWEKIPSDVTNVQGYLNGAVRRSLYKLLELKIDRSVQTLSLDKENGDLKGTLFETLEAPSSPAQAELQRTEKVSEVVHAALYECMLEEQEYCVTILGMNDFTPIAPEKRRRLGALKKDGKARQTGNIRESVKCVLRRNPQVKALVQRETCAM
jgi:hypothetical protein